MLKEKEQILKGVLASLGKVLVAFSGGVDSTYLLYAAKTALGAANVLAVVAESPTYPVAEIEDAIKVADELGVKLRQIKTEEFADENFVTNSRERCYYCKKELFAKMKALAQENGLNQVIDGSNADDVNDYRPGSKAKEEFGVRSPLLEADLTKEEIRKLSLDAGLRTWDKPSMACLASRIPYGTRIDEAILKMVGEGEKYLRSLGFKQLRVRHHDKIARIEVDSASLSKVMDQKMIDGIIKKFEDLGYTYITLDLKGYRPGSMNEQ
jgi:pyridinium-3,5-biscarboxylic acid mononucleotide sulfurtransferase